MGVVWRGVHRTSNLPVAVKALRGDRAWDQRLLDLFAVEVRAVAGMTHPGIVLVLDHGRIPQSTEDASGGLIPAGSPYLAMELTTGGTLLDRAGLLEWPELLVLCRALLGALAHAHARGVVHRDIKPGNVLLSRPEDIRQGPRLTDFGIAHLPPSPTEEIAAPEGFFGSPSYIAPEQIDASRGPIGPWTDLYSLGCLLWAVTTNAPVFTGGTGMELASRHLTDEVGDYNPIRPVRRGFEPWLRALLTKAPHRRFQRAADAAWWLDRVDPTRPRRSSPGGASPRGRSPWSTDPRRRRPPVPFDWRPSEPAEPPLRLEGAGLGLYGLRRIPIVAREAERDRLWDALRDVEAEGAMQVVILRGASGYGKTVLARWIGERAEELGAARRVRAVHGPNGGPGTGLGPMLGRLLRSRGMEPAAVLERAEERLKRLGTPEPYVWHGLARLVAPGPHTGFATPTERYAVATAYLAAEARQRPLVLELDDVQWGDDVLRLVDHLLRVDTQTPLPLLVVVTVRDEALVKGTPAALFLDLLASRPRVQDLTLGPLDRAASARLVEELLGLHGTLAAEVVERAGGNPMFAVQLVGDWVARGLLEVRDGSFALRPGSAAQVPDDIHDVWADRFDRALSKTADTGRSAVEIAATLGVEVDIKEWSLACVKAGFTVPQGLVGALARAGLISADVAGFSFVHGMARESLERSARDARRWGAHSSAAADAVLARGLERDAERGARHLLEAGRVDEAVEQLRVAADHRTTIGEYDASDGLLDLREAALDRLRAPADDPRRSRALLQRARLLRLRGRSEEGAARAEEARQAALLAGRPGVTAAALRELGIRARDVRRLDDARTLLQQSVALYEELEDDAGLAESSRSLGLVFRIQGDYESARKSLGRALALQEAAGDLREASLSLSALAGTWLETGDAERAEVLLRRGLALIQGTGFLRGLERIWRDLGAVLASRNKLAEAAELTARARDIAEKLERDASIASISNQQGEIARKQGDLVGAEAFYRSALKAYGRVSRALTILPRVNLTLVLRAQGQWDEVRPILEVARSDAASQGRRGITDILDALILPCFARDRDWAAFDATAASLADFQDGSDRVDDDAAESLELAAEYAAGAGEPDRAAVARRFAVVRWRALGRSDRIEEIDEASPDAEQTTIDEPVPRG
jgi:tetratricopeptide (TPR) repeat protein